MVNAAPLYIGVIMHRKLLFWSFLNSDQTFSVSFFAAIPNEFLPVIPLTVMI